MAIPLIDQLLKGHSLDDIIITFFSPSGYTQAAKGPYAKSIMYLPLDRLKFAQQFLNNYAPQKAIFIRYDFWYNFIYEGQKRGVQFYLVNGRFQRDHFIFNWVGKPHMRLLKGFEQVFTSDTTSNSLLDNYAINSTHTGDTRYDRVADISKEAIQYKEIESFKGERRLLVLGSSWEQEEELVAYLQTHNLENLAILIAPHDLKRSVIIMEKFEKYSPKRYSDSSFSNKDQILILDTIGMLSAMYRYADFALIGGGFKGALHNILEPAVWGCHLSFGPKIGKFPEAGDFIDAGFAMKVTDRENWVEEVTILLHNTALLENVKTKARSFTASQVGATKIILDNIG